MNTQAVYYAWHWIGLDFFLGPAVDPLDWIVTWPDPWLNQSLKSPWDSYVYRHIIIHLFVKSHGKLSTPGYRSVSTHMSFIWSWSKDGVKMFCLSLHLKTLCGHVAKECSLIHMIHHFYVMKLVNPNTFFGNMVSCWDTVFLRGFCQQTCVPWDTAKCCIP